MTYQIYIKSHCESPDFEAECEAETKEEAAKEFSRRLNSFGEDYWSPEDIINYISEE